MINGRCHTNLDDYNMVVTKFYAIPNINDKVECYHKGQSATLRVCGITHKMGIGNDCNEPFIIVELTK